MIRSRYTCLPVVATALWIAASGVAFASTSPDAGGRAVSQASNDESIPAHIALLGPNELVSSDEVDTEPCEIAREVSGGEASTPTTLVSVEIDTSLGKAVLDELVDIEDPEDQDQTRYYVPRTFVGALGAETVPHVSLGDRALLAPFRLRAFAGRAPPTV